MRTYILLNFVILCVLIYYNLLIKFNNFSESLEGDQSLLYCMDQRTAETPPLDVSYLQSRGLSSELVLL